MKNNRIIKNKSFRILLITAFWIGVWFIVSLLINNSLLFPTPIMVIKRLFTLLITKDFWKITITSLLRVTLGMIIAILIGFIFAFISYKIKFIYETLYPIMTVLKATPVASFIILIVLFIGKSYVPTIITILMVMPIVWLNVYEGFSNVSTELKEVCKIYSFSFAKKMKVLYIPSILPYFISAVLSSIGLGWKAGIAAEILYPPLKSIGKSILDAKLYLLTDDLFAWTFVVIALSLALEGLVKLVVNKFTSANKFNGAKDESN